MEKMDQNQPSQSRAQPEDCWCLRSQPYCKNEEKLLQLMSFCIRLRQGGKRATQTHNYWPHDGRHAYCMQAWQSGGRDLGSQTLPLPSPALNTSAAEGRGSNSPKKQQNLTKGMLSVSSGCMTWISLLDIRVLHTERFTCHAFFFFFLFTFFLPVSPYSCPLQSPFSQFNITSPHNPSRSFWWFSLPSWDGGFGERWVSLTIVDWTQKFNAILAQLCQLSCQIEKLIQRQPLCGCSGRCVGWTDGLKIRGSIP